MVYPTYWNSRIASAGALMEYLPSKSVDVPTRVPFTTIDAPTRADPSVASVTVPDTWIFCAKATEVTASNYHNFKNQIVNGIR